MATLVKPTQSRFVRWFRQFRKTNKSPYKWYDCDNCGIDKTRRDQSAGFSSQNKITPGPTPGVDFYASALTLPRHRYLLMMASRLSGPAATATKKLNRIT